MNINGLCAVDRTLHKCSHICGYTYIGDRYADACCSAAAYHNANDIDTEFLGFVTALGCALRYELIHDLCGIHGVIEISILVFERLAVVVLRNNRSRICNHIDSIACCKRRILRHIRKDVGVQKFDRDARADTCHAASCDRA